MEEKTYEPVDEMEEIDVLQFLSNKKMKVGEEILDFVEDNHGVKWYLTLCVRFTKTDNDGEEEIEVAYFNSKVTTFLQHGDEEELSESIDPAYFKLHNSMENFCRLVYCYYLFCVIDWLWKLMGIDGY